MSSDPGIGRRAASEPVATTSSSYGYTVPAAVVTVLPAVSMPVTRSPVCSDSASWSHIEAAAQGEVDVGVGEGLAQRDAVVGEVGFLGEDGDVPAVQAPGVHGVGETVGGRAAAGNHDAARCCGALCALVLGA